MTLLCVLGCGGAPQPAPSSTPKAPPPALEFPTKTVQVREGEQLEGTQQLLPPGFEVVPMGLPPGATWNRRGVVWRPDSIQGGRRYTVRTLVRFGGSPWKDGWVTHIDVENNQAPPAPVEVKREDRGDFTVVHLKQPTDAFLDSPGFAGRQFDAWVVVPKKRSGTLPVEVHLHGFSGNPDLRGAPDRIRVLPHDPHATYWWGYGETLPAAPPMSGFVPPYTVRRVLHLLEYALKAHDGDPERVYVVGKSMGGAGAATLGLLWGRHFAGVRATHGQSVPRNHRPKRIKQLSGWWGTPEANLPRGPGLPGIWDAGDLTQVLQTDPIARNQFLDVFHAKDDHIIHFGAALDPSPKTQRSFYATLEAEHIGHRAIWDEGGHFAADPELGENWWTGDPILSGVLRRDAPFPAFNNAAGAPDPGTGGTGDRDVNAAFAGSVKVVGDTRWNGDRTGVRNGSFRYQPGQVLDRVHEVAMPLEVDGPATEVDVTLRRTRFRPRPGEEVLWTFGDDAGTATADDRGEVTLRLTLTGTWQTLRLTR